MRRLAIALTTLALALPAAAAGSATFVPNDPLAVRQWYLNAIHAFDFWPADPVNDLAPVRVAKATARLSRASSPLHRTTARGSPASPFPHSC